MDKYNLHWPVIIIVALLLIAILVIYLLSTRKKAEKTWTPRDKFQEALAKMTPDCNEFALENFIEFLKSYQGGFVRNQLGQQEFKEYTVSEQKALKDVFLRMVLPNPKLTTTQKEEYRQLIVSLGVEGLNERPEYETRDTISDVKSTDEDESFKNEIGVTGEMQVRDVLNLLKEKGYSVINGAALKDNNMVKDYDHIVIGPTGVFFLETKAFGMRDGEGLKSYLYIEEGDKWTIKRSSMTKELTSPTKQIKLQKSLLAGILIDYPVDIHPLLVLSNTKIQLKTNIELPYDIVNMEEVVDYILKCDDFVDENDRVFMLGDIDKCRIN